MQKVKATVRQRSFSPGRATCCWIKTSKLHTETTHVIFPSTDSKASVTTRKI